MEKSGLAPDFLRFGVSDCPKTTLRIGFHRSDLPPSKDFWDFMGRPDLGVCLPYIGVTLA
jgi:hypothetical protein